MSEMIVKDKHGHIVLQEGQMIVGGEYLKEIEQKARENTGLINGLSLEVKWLKKELELIKLTTPQLDYRWYPPSVFRGEKIYTREELGDEGYIYSGYSEGDVMYSPRELWVKKETIKEKQNGIKIQEL
jgi:hypothetical protein